MLEDAQSPYEVHSYALDEYWQDLKTELEPKLNFGQLPLLEDGDFVLVQTPSIIRYISRKLDLLPASLMDTARADMVADATQELADRWMTKTMALGNTAKAKRDYARHAQRVLTGLEKILKAKNEGKAYFISDNVRPPLDLNLQSSSFPDFGNYFPRF
jgi:glutathione S-transferase